MYVLRWKFIVLAAVVMILAGCSHHAPQTNSRLSDSREVKARLHQQLAEWRGTPYRYGGLDRHGVDCSGFVFVTFRDKFGLQLPRSTEDQVEVGSRIDKEDLLPGDLIFFKTGSGNSGMHVGIYDANEQFIHASTSKGVIRSSLNNVYWKRAYWQARRI
ncbi:probable lipoprotein NlpC [Lonsdalea quercina]|uniref:Probable lipoprotein NlpC n=2 Tax=Lonsdalea quercina TaxID=71657 RepID=A0A1H3YKG3_9GAMM|nr:probable lipoprotein NlpC [Lonsdalea quercina]